jgi:hypothetical protein
LSVVALPRGPDSANALARPPCRHVLVLYERCPSGAAALREAVELTSGGGELTVVTLAPQARPSRCCGGSQAGTYNCAIREEAALELREAHEILGSAAERAAFKVLIERRDPPLAAWAGEQCFHLVLLPARRLTRGGNRAARRLRSSIAAEVRVVGRQQ